MDKQTLRYTYLEYFRNQIVNDQFIDVNVLLNMAQNSHIAKLVLDELVQEGFIEGIEYIESSDNSLAFISNEPIKLTEKGYKELLNQIESEQQAMIGKFKAQLPGNNSEFPFAKMEQLIKFKEQLIQKNNELRKDKKYNTSFKLLYIYLDGFKNLKNIEINCNDKDNFLLIIGNNASGKSNILEAISAIFTEVYTRKRTPGFKYELKYVIENKEITIKRDDESPHYEINKERTSRQKIIQDNLLPSKILAIYSGEETRLWEEYYEKFYFPYLRDLTSNTYDTFGRKMLYINKYYWNIALLTLLLSDKKDHVEFTENKLHIDKNSVKINFDFNLAFLTKNKSKELEGFINEINPDKKETINFSLNELKNILLPDFTFEKQQFVEKYTLEQIFEIFVYASMPKFKKAFKNLEISFNNGLSIKSLSEGEKKYILIYTIVEILADENSIVLMDEPDAHIHETGKEIICDLFEKYSKEYNRQIIVTTHSPTLVHCINDNHIIMIENNKGTSSVITQDRKDKIKKLTGGIWTETQQNIFLNSNNTLILFEGMGDIKYVKTAIKLFKKEFPNLRNLDFLPFGGAQNACEYIKELRSITSSNKKIIVIFDRDEGGYEGLKKCLPPGSLKQGRNDNTSYRKKDCNIVYLMLPKTEFHNYKDFLIEDYFSTDLKKQFAQNKIDEANGIFNLYSKDLKNFIKNQLAKQEYHTKENMVGFKLLLKKIENIINQEPL